MVSGLTEDNMGEGNISQKLVNLEKEYGSKERELNGLMKLQKSYKELSGLMKIQKTEEE